MQETLSSADVDVVKVVEKQPSLLVQASPAVHPSPQQRGASRAGKLSGGLVPDSLQTGMQGDACRPLVTTALPATKYAQHVHVSCKETGSTCEQQLRKRWYRLKAQRLHHLLILWCLLTALPAQMERPSGDTGCGS